ADFSQLALIDNLEEGGFLLAIDGPSGTGKSTVSRRIAQYAGARYLDTGAMYRVATLHVLKAGIDPADPAATEAIIEATSQLPLQVNEDPQSTEVLLDGEDVSADIRGPEVTAHVSAVAAIPEVRTNLVQLQRDLAAAAGRCVVEGRDIGTVVLPDAPVKVYMTASAEVRAQRRFDQDTAAGREVSYEAVLADVQRRDEADSTRETSPLRPAEDATILDTGEMSIEEVIEAIAGLIEESDLDSDIPDGGAENTGGLVFRTVEGDVVPAEGGAPVQEESEEDLENWDPENWDGETWEVDPEQLGEHYLQAEEFDLLESDEEDTDWESIEEAFGIADELEAQKEALCTVAIVGRPNVGKSTLVNRFIGRREAVVEDFPGVTRDRISYLGDWGGRRFWVQDTGGWDPDAKGIHAAIARQAETAMATADAIVFVVDTKVGITETDEVIARKLQRSDVPVIVVANKFESDTQYADMAEFWALGLDNPYPVSALHGRGAADVLDKLLEVFPEKPRELSVVSGPRRVALVGRPNVGKSSLLNTISGEQRSVVDNVACTTVDPVDSIVELEERTWRFVDTAGIRKKVKNAVGHEYYASLRTRAAIDASEVVVFLVDASEPIAEQ